MPSQHYRRKLRTKTTQSPQLFYNVYVLPTIVQKQSGECELDKIRSYFLNVIDMLIQYDTFTETTQQLQSIIQSVHTYVEYYRILDSIEENLLSVALNISENVNSKLIQSRIHYIQTYINDLPPICQDTGPVAELIVQLIESIIQSVDIPKISSTIQTIQSYLTEKYGNMSEIETIQTNILNIIESIQFGVNKKIVEVRINFVKDLIQSMPILK